MPRKTQILAALATSSEGSEASNRGISRKIGSKALRRVEARIVISKRQLQDYDISGRSPDRTLDEGCGNCLPAPVHPSQHALEQYHRVEAPLSRYLAPQQPPRQDGQYCTARSEGVAKSLATPTEPNYMLPAFRGRNALARFGRCEQAPSATRVVPGIPPSRGKIALHAAFPARFV